ncbi:hypothetical protein IQ07DRAFT_650679 [Pyrenochaeta sp. DS3sAY3a]|nr:hypothetical protein IQ07DRAFT_650679 [Pyrenochaeta sp. DS3sAY3a]
MESAINDASQARRSDRARTKTPKAAELENPDVQDKNNEHTTDDNIDVETNIPRAPRIKRTRPTVSATIGKGTFTGKGKDATTKETLASILEALEELKDNNTDLKVAVGELTTELTHVKAQLAETKQQLAHATESISTLSNTWSDSRTEGSSPRSYASVLARSINPSSSASRPTSGNTNDNSSRDSGPPGVTIDTRRVRDAANIAQENAADIETKIRTRIHAQESLKNVQIKGIQIRGHHIRVLTSTKEEATLLRASDRWVNQAFEGARTRGEEWHPVKIDDVVKAAVVSGDGHTISDGFIATFCVENKVTEIKKAFWLSKGNKPTGSMTIFLASKEEAHRLIDNRLVKIGGQIAFTDPGCPEYKREKANLMQAFRVTEAPNHTLTSNV